MLSAHAGGVRFDPSPHHDRAADQIMGHGRSRARTRCVRGIDPAPAPWGRRFRRVMIAGGAARGHLGGQPRCRSEHRSQRAVDQPPMAKPDDRLDQVRRELHARWAGRRSWSWSAPAVTRSRPFRPDKRPGALARQHTVKLRQRHEYTRHSDRIDPILQAAEADPPVLELGHGHDQITQRTSQSIQPAHHQTIMPITQLQQRPLELGPLTPRPGIGKPPLATGSRQGLELQLQALTILATDIRVADQHSPIFSRAGLRKPAWPTR